MSKSPHLISWSIFLIAYHLHSSSSHMHHLNSSNPRAPAYSTNSGSATAGQTRASVRFTASPRPSKFLKADSATSILPCSFKCSAVAYPDPAGSNGTSVDSITAASSAGIAANATFA